MCTSFCAPSPSRTTCKREVEQHRIERRAETAQHRRRPRRGMRACRAWPVANSSTVSLVEVSLSTVVQLKLAATPRASIACKAAAGIAASVKTKQSIVAMSGAIMPLPLAMPQMRTSVSPIRAVRVAALGKVSVVMMPRAAASHPSSASEACSEGSAAVRRSCGSTSPITPVEARNTSRGRQPIRRAASAAVARRPRRRRGR